MKKLLFVLMMFFMSCNAVFFDTPQPMDGKILYDFPDKLEGKYLNEDNDTVIIKNNSITTLSKYDSADYENQKIFSKVENSIQLGHRFIKADEGKYFYNELIMDSLWFISYMEFSDDTLNFYFSDLNENLRKTIFRNFEADSLSGDNQGSVLIHSKRKDIYKFIELGLFNEKLKLIKVK